MPSNPTAIVLAFTNKRIAITLLLMFASAFPLVLTGTGTTFQVWMARNGVDLKSIAFMGLVGLPYSLKLFWAPLLDRYSPPWLGRRTGWIVVFEILLFIAIAVMGFLSPSKQLNLVMYSALLISFLSASADIVIDAYRVDLLRKEELGAGAAVVVLGSRIAFLSSGAMALILADHMEWKWVYLILASCLIVGVVASFIAPEPEDDIKPPQTLSDAVINPLANFLQRPGSIIIIIFVVFFKLGDTLASALLSPFLVHLNFSNTDIGFVNKVFGMISTILGAFIAGGAIARFGVYRLLWISGILQLLSNFVFVGLAMHGKDYVWMVASIGVENLCGGMGTAAFTAFLMSLCDKRFSATQYALLTSIMSVARTVMPVPAYYMISILGWPIFFVSTAVAAVPGLILLYFMDKDAG